MSGRPRLRGRAARLARLLPYGPVRAARTPFVLLVVLLLGGGLIGLLVLNSALSEGSFRQADLQKDTKNLTDQEQALQRDVDAYSAPDALQRRARELGMVPGGDPAFLEDDGTVKGVPSPAATPQQAAARSPLVLAPEAMPGAAPQEAAPKAASAPAPGADEDAAEPGGAEPGGAEPGGAEPGGAEPDPADRPSPGTGAGTPTGTESGTRPGAATGAGPHPEPGTKPGTEPGAKPGAQPGGASAVPPSTPTPTPGR